MESAEKMVLRRRKQHLAEVVQVTDGFLRDLKAEDVLTAEMVNMILLEKVNQTRMYRLIEAILSQKPVDGFAKFCLVISKTQKWLSRDLIADLRVEKGEIQAQPEIVEEAAILVHRKFGTSKRFSEGDKKEMAEMVAIKLQIAQEEFKKESSRMEEELNVARDVIRSREDLARKVYDIQRAFVRKYQAQLVSHAHDTQTTRDAIEKCLRDPPNEVLVQFKDNLERLLKQVELALNQREGLFYEKEKCLKMLGVTNLRVPLDTVISKRTGMAVNADMEAEDKNVVIKKLQKRVDELEKKVENYAAGEVEFKRQLAERDREISKLRHMVQI